MFESTKPGLEVGQNFRIYIESQLQHVKKFKNLQPMFCTITFNRIIVENEKNQISKNVF